MSRSATFPRVASNLVVALIAVLLVQVFLFQVPRYLVTHASAEQGVAPLAAPDWATQVESIRTPGSHGAGSGALRDGVPAAPELD